MLHIPSGAIGILSGTVVSYYRKGLPKQAVASNQEIRPATNPDKRIFVPFQIVANLEEVTRYEVDN